MSSAEHAVVDVAATLGMMVGAALMEMPVQGRVMGVMMTVLMVRVIGVMNAHVVNAMPMMFRSHYFLRFFLPIFSGKFFQD